MTRHEMDRLELGLLPAAYLLCEQVPDDAARERHIRLVAGQALTVHWARDLAQGRVPS